MKNRAQKIPLFDLSQSAFHMLRGDEPELSLQPSGRVAFLHEARGLFFELAARYNENEPVPVQDYVNCQRRLRAAMITLKNEKSK